MKKLISALTLCLLPSLALAGTMDVKTGIGYIKDSDGKIICKYDLPKGQHPLKDGYTYTEIATKQDLDKVVVYQEPVRVLTTEEKLEKVGLSKQDLKDLLK